MAWYLPCVPIKFLWTGSNYMNIWHGTSHNHPKSTAKIWSSYLYFLKRYGPPPPQKKKEKEKKNWQLHAHMRTHYLSVACTGSDLWIGGWDTRVCGVDERVAFFFMVQQPNLGLGHLILQVSRSHTIRHTHIPGRTSLNEWPAYRRSHHLHNTQQTQETNILDLSRIWTPGPSNQADSYLCLKTAQPLGSPSSTLAAVNI
jgi:hypothetical protein